MRQLDSGTGKEQKAIDVTAAMETMDIMSMSGIAVDKTGTIFLADNNSSRRGTSSPGITPKTVSLAT